MNGHQRGISRLLHCAGVALFCASTTGVSAAEYPERPVRIIVPNPPGGGPDTSTRTIAPMLAELLGRPVIVDNRAGASGNLGAEAAARSAPDGYTLLTALGSLASNPAVMKHVPYDLDRSFAPITQTVTVPLALVGHPSLPAHTLKELFALAKARPGQIEYGSAGQGSIAHLSMELLLSMAGLKMLHVPYKGIAQATIDLVSGQVSLAAINVLTSLPHVRSGRLRAYGVTSAQRSSAAPELPTIAESGLPGYTAVQWYGLLAPAGTPREIVVKLHATTLRVLQEPAIRKRFVNDGAEPTPSATPAEFGAFIRAELAKWARVVKAQGIQPE